MKAGEKIMLENDIAEPVGHLVRHRFPWLFLGLLGGILVSFIVSRYENILASDIRLAFFIPMIVYMGDAVGTQTETIYVRYIRKEDGHFWKYIAKETVLGLSLGAIFGLIIGGVAVVWLRSLAVALSVGLAMFVTVSTAPILATIIPRALYKRHSDPALGSGPLATILQDLISVMVYFFIASTILFG